MWNNYSKGAIDKGKEDAAARLFNSENPYFLPFIDN